MINFTIKSHYGWEDLLQVVSILRSPGGCPWDAEQTHSSIRRNFLEETYEALDALDRDDRHDMCEELGDVLLQVVFHAQMESERGRFTMDDVVDGVTQKLVYRHPHVFGDDQTAEDGAVALAKWDEMKRREKGQKTAGDAIESVPHTLPSLWRAEKINAKAARAGFDWSDPLDALEKLEEEIRELRWALESHIAADGPHGVMEELGDVLFMAAKIGQMTGQDPEEALHRSCDKFAQRFRRVEDLADRSLSQYTEAELTQLWKQAKAQKS